MSRRARTATEGVADLIKAAKQAGYEWVFIDTPPNMSAAVTDAIHAATLVIIPARLTVFDIAAVKETMDLCRKLGKALRGSHQRGVPARRDDASRPMCVRRARC